MRVTGRREWKFLDLTSTSWLLLCLKKNASSCILRSMVSACLFFALRQQAELHVLASPNQELLMDRTCDAAGRDLTKPPPTWQSLEVLRSLTCSRCRAEYAENHNLDWRYRAILGSPFSSPSIRASHTDNAGLLILSAARHSSRLHRSKAPVHNGQDKCLHSQICQDKILFTQASLPIVITLERNCAMPARISTEPKGWQLQL
jgi:hypothetical protein